MKFTTLNYLIMNDFYVNVRLKVVWQFKDFPHYKITRDKQIINSKTQKILIYNQRGYFIGNRYIKKKDINKFVEKIPITQYCPFSNNTIKL